MGRRIGLLAIALWACTSSAPDGIGVPRAERPSRPDAREPAPAAPRARAIGVGERWSCALLEGGDVRCWGNTRLAARGVTATPVSIGIDDGVALAVGPQHACIARTDGSVWCWGDNRDGQLGDGTTEARGAPVRVPGLTGVIEIAAGGHHTCARDRQGAVWCWGHEGCVGHARSAAARSPGRVEPMPPAARLVAGDDVTCAFFDGAGAPRCWGFNTVSLLGAELGPVTRPIISVPLAGAATLAVGFRHACVAQRDDGGVVYCAGNDQFGQLGDQYVPDDAQCNPRDGDRVTCTWTEAPPPRVRPEGGPPMPANLPPPPAPERRTRSFPQRRTFVLAGDGVRATALSAGDGRTCAITRAGTVSCWGQWYAGLDWAHRRPRVIPGTEGATAVSVYKDHACAIVGGEVRCWGYATAGELGDGRIVTEMTATREAAPVRW